jgi:hypothetical protein
MSNHWTDIGVYVPEHGSAFGRNFLEPLISLVLAHRAPSAELLEPASQLDAYAVQRLADELRKVLPSVRDADKGPPPQGGFAGWTGSPRTLLHIHIGKASPANGVTKSNS